MSRVSFPLTFHPAGSGWLGKIAGLAFGGLGLWMVLAASTALEHERFPVAGRLHVDGKPAAGATISLFPLGLQGPSGRALAWGTADESGGFRVRTLGWAAGAPAGRYAVTVVYRPTEVTGEDLVEGPQILATAITQPGSTPLGIEIHPRINELGTLSFQRPSPPVVARPSPPWFLLAPIESAAL